MESNGVFLLISWKTPQPLVIKETLQNSTEYNNVYAAAVEMNVNLQTLRSCTVFVDTPLLRQDARILFNRLSLSVVQVQVMLHFLETINTKQRY